MDHSKFIFKCCYYVECECPEMQWNEPNLREVLNDLMMIKKKLCCNIKKQCYRLYGYIYYGWNNIQRIIQKNNHVYV